MAIDRMRRNLLLLPILLLGLAAPATAGDFELTLLGGLRMSWGDLGYEATDASSWLRDNSSFGLAVGFPQKEPDRMLEVVWSHQESRVGVADGEGAVGVDLDTVGVGGTYESTESKAWRPFVSATGGLTVMSPEEAGYSYEALLTLTVGAGAKVPLSKKVGLRFEGRGLLMFSVTGAAGVCNNGACLVGFSGGGFGQVEVLAGVYWSP